MAEISREDIQAFKEMAGSFSKRSIAPILAHESPDGDLSKLPGILREAFDTGLLASPSPEAPGHETGIWGSHVLDAGPRLSLLLLEELAVACGGAAMNLHALGIASLLLQMAKDLPGKKEEPAAVALCENGFPPGPGTVMNPDAASPARIETIAKKDGDGYVLTGAKHFVWQGVGTGAYLVFARADKEWLAFLVPAKADGLKAEDVGFRMGLRACPLVHLNLDNVKADAPLEFERPMPEVVSEYLRLWWLGQVAIAAGIARGAVAAAWDYAEERFQGCTEIINHPGMGMLFSDSEARVLACQGLLDRAATQNGSPKNALRDAARAKLNGLYAALGAVTDSLQVFGGYGYMEDYRMEKRYRDVNTLKSAGGGPRDLRMIIAEIGREERS